jgi:hypothetical protein
MSSSKAKTDSDENLVRDLRDVEPGRKGIRDEEEEQLSPVRMLRVKKRANRAIRILTKGRKHIPVEFKTDSDSSYTDGERITIGTDITESLTHSVIGLALHEASHIVKSDFDFLRDYKDRPLEELPEWLKEIADEEGEDHRWVSYVVDRMTNMVEDRRIDAWCHRTRPGFRKYVRSVYERYDQDPRLTDVVKSDEMREEDWDSYMFRVSTLTNEAAEANLGALEELERIHRDVLDLENIERLRNHQHAYDVACRIAEAIMRAVDEPRKDLPDEDEWKGGGGEGSPEPAPGIPSGAKSAFEDMMDHREDSESSKQPASEDVKQALDEAEDREDVGDDESGRAPERREAGDGEAGRFDVVVVPRLGMRMIREAKYCCLSREDVYFSAVQRGARLGRTLANRLRVRDERRSRDVSRKRRGKLDGRMLAEIGYSDRVFYRTVDESHDDGFVHISLDASGSMQRDGRWKEAITCAAAIAKACDIVGSVRCQVSIRATTNDDFMLTRSPLFIMLFDSEVQSFESFELLAPHIIPAGETPEGLCYDASMREILGAADERDAYLVNVSDGEPGFSEGTMSGPSYRGKAAERHTRKQVDRIKSEGISVLSYFVGEDGSEERFEFMYGKSAEFIDVTSVTSIARTLNNMMMKK